MTAATKPPMPEGVSVTTRKPLQDVQRIRALLSPERAARRAQPAPDRRSFAAFVDDRPVRVYPQPAPKLTQAEVDARVRADQDALRQARETGCVVRLGVTDRPEAMRGLPTPEERAQRTRRALARIAAGGLVRGHVARRDVLRLDAVYGGWR